MTLSGVAAYLEKDLKDRRAGGEAALRAVRGEMERVERLRESIVDRINDDDDWKSVADYDHLRGLLAILNAEYNAPPVEETDSENS